MIKLKLNLKYYVFINLNYGEIWFKLLDEVSMFYVFFVLEIIYFMDDIDFEWFIRVFSDNKEVIIVGGSYCNFKG